MVNYILPNGQEAESLADFEKYMKEANITVASDYSQEYIANKRYQRQQAEKDEAFLDFVHAYKKHIWSA